MVGKEKPNLYVDQIIWRELVASIMLSVCIAAWMIDMPVQERAAEQVCGNNVVNMWRSRSPKHWASKMLRRLGRILIAAQVRILQDHIATGDNLLSEGSNWKHLREGGSLKEVHRDFVFNELPRKGRARVYKGVYPPQFQCTRLVLEGSLRFVGQGICQRNERKLQHVLEEVVALLRCIRQKWQNCTNESMEIFVVWIAWAKENDMNPRLCESAFQKSVEGLGGRAGSGIRHHEAIKESKTLLASSKAGAQSRRKEGADVGHGRVGSSSATSAAARRKN